jgi:hypothetical protein
MTVQPVLKRRLSTFPLKLSRKTADMTTHGPLALRDLDRNTLSCNLLLAFFKRRHNDTPHRRIETLQTIFPS